VPRVSLFDRLVALVRETSGHDGEHVAGEESSGSPTSGSKGWVTDLDGAAECQHAKGQKVVSSVRPCGIVKVGMLRIILPKGKLVSVSCSRGSKHKWKEKGEEYDRNGHDRSSSQMETCFLDTALTS